jgi:endonuclease YncB( thermonuclease family)
LILTVHSSRFIIKYPLLILFSIFSLIAVVRGSDRWVTLNDCRYLPNPANDGDSFHVQAGGKEYIFRLYFVDTPETDASVPGRVAEQAKYFAVTAAQTLQIGLEAEGFTRQQLARPFTVRTCKQDARGRSRRKRYFAFVQIDNADLGELLVANGLARVFGAASDPPGMNTPRVEWRKLKQLERRAKEQKIGGWGIGSGRLNTRTVAQPQSSLGERLDVNTASIEALQEIPEIGLVLAKRIIAARPFRSADDLREVKGIGGKRYAALRPFFE